MPANYQKELDVITADAVKSGIRPRILLQSCCGPCSSYVLEYLTQFFDVTILFYNPNIYPPEEYEKRLSEQRRLLSLAEFGSRVGIAEVEYDPEAFTRCAQGLESEREGGARCERCFELRLARTALMASEDGFDYFGSTLTVSPHKNAALINAVGERLAAQSGVKWLPSDCKKREGYKQSVELSKQFDLYRQDYCGCTPAVQSSTL